MRREKKKRRREISVENRRADTWKMITAGWWWIGGYMLVDSVMGWCGGCERKEGKIIAAG